MTRPGEIHFVPGSSLIVCPSESMAREQSRRRLEPLGDPGRVRRLSAGDLQRNYAAAARLADMPPGTIVDLGPGERFEYVKPTAERIIQAYSARRFNNPATRLVALMTMDQEHRQRERGSCQTCLLAR